MGQNVKTQNRLHKFRSSWPLRICWNGSNAAVSFNLFQKIQILKFQFSKFRIKKFFRPFEKASPSYLKSESNLTSVASSESFRYSRPFKKIEKFKNCEKSFHVRKAFILSEGQKNREFFILEPSEA